MKITELFKQTFRSVEWSERLRQMWLPILFALCFGTVVCIYSSQPKERTVYGVEYEIEDSGNTAEDYVFIDEAEPTEEADEPAEEEIRKPLLTRNQYYALCLFFGLGYLIIGLLQISPYALKLRKPMDKKAWTSLAILLSSLSLLALDSCWIASENDWSLAVKIGHWAVYTSLFFGIFIIPTLKHPNDKQMHRFFAETIIIGALLTLSVGLSTLALVGLLEGVESLFGIELEHFQKNLSIIMMLSVLPILLVMLLPKPDKEGFATPFAQRLCKIGGQFILLPLMALYMLVLYAYIVKIGISWELPKGTVTWMTTVMMVELLFTAFLLYPRIYGEANGRFWLFVRKALPWLAIPPLALMTIGLIRRVNDYGWTVDRFYATAFNAWCYMACLMLIIASFREKKVLTRLIASFCLFFLLLSVIPGMNVAQFTQRLLTRQISDRISQADVAFPDTAIYGKDLPEWLDRLPVEQAEPIYSKMHYMRNTFGNASISEWIKVEYDEDGFVHRSYWHWYPKDSIDARGEILLFGSNIYREFVDIPQGYTKVRNLSYSAHIEEDADGKFILDFRNDSLRLTINPNNINPDASTINIPKANGDIIVLYYLRINEYSYNGNKGLSHDVDGYIFSK